MSDSNATDENKALLNVRMTIYLLNFRSIKLYG